MFADFSKALLLFIGAATTVEACDLHHFVARDAPLDTIRGPHVRRQVLASSMAVADTGARDWNYTDSAAWGDIKPGMMTNFMCRFGPILTKIRSIQSLQDRQAAIPN